MRIKLTDQAINKAGKDAEADGERRELSDAGCPGLRIRITPNGTRSWVLGMRDKLGNPRRFPLGNHPTLGISGAREAAREMRHKVQREGADPIAEKRRGIALGKDARKGVGTLKALLDAYGTSNAAPKSWQVGRPRVEALFKPLLDRPYTIISLNDLQSQVDRHPNPKSAAFVVRTFRPVLTWASTPGRDLVSPDLKRLSSSTGSEARKRVLSEPELQVLLPQLRGANRPHARMMRFLLLTLARREEAATATWKSVNLESAMWTILETKNGEPHVVPLSRQALALLREIGPGKPDELVFRTSTGARLGNWDRETKRIILDSGLGEKKGKSAVVMKDGSAIWTRHDLRRTGATMLGELVPCVIDFAVKL
jgi:integrase